MLIFASCLPQTYWLYDIIWVEYLSDDVYRIYTNCYTWISTLLVLDSAAGAGLGYIEYKSKPLDPKLAHTLR